MHTEWPRAAIQFDSSRVVLRGTVQSADDRRSGNDARVHISLRRNYSSIKNKPILNLLCEVSENRLRNVQLISITVLIGILLNEFPRNCEVFDKTWISVFYGFILVIWG